MSKSALGFTQLNGIGTLPYSQHLMELNLTTLAERRLRGNLIETFRVVNGHVDYGHNVFNVSKFGNKLIAKSLKEGDTTIEKLLKSFLPERIRNYWNKEVQNEFLRNNASVAKRKGINIFKDYLST